MVYTLFPFQKEILKDRFKHEPDLKRVFKRKKNFNPIIEADIKERLKHPEEQNWVLLQVNGEPGSKKSSVGQAFAALYFENNFSAKNISQEYSVFLDQLDRSKPKESFMLDEQIFQRGIGSIRFKESIINLTETLRLRGNNMVFITPREKFISDENVTYTLEPMGFDMKTKVVRCLVRKVRYLGFFYIKLNWNGKLWREYEKGKNEFLERTKSQRYKKYDYEAEAAVLAQNIPQSYTKKVKRIVLYVEKNAPNLTKEERDLLIEQVKIFLEDGVPEELKQKSGE